VVFEQMLQERLLCTKAGILEINKDPAVLLRRGQPIVPLLRAQLCRRRRMNVPHVMQQRGFTTTTRANDGRILQRPLAQQVKETPQLPLPTKEKGRIGNGRPGDKG